jgi:hypothetical protein
MELRLETLVSLAGLMLEDQSQLPPALITELRKFSGNPEPEVISDSDPRKYMHVAAGILNDISTGALKPGDQVPARDKLAERFGVSIPTAIKGVRLLAQRDVVEFDSNAYWVS